MIMKKINKYLTPVIVSFVLVFWSCETTNLDMTNNPNSLTPDQASIDFFINSIQEDFVRQIEGDADYDVNDNWQSGGSTNGDGLSLFGSQLTRLMALTSSKKYNTNFLPSDSDDEWINAYTGIMQDIRTMVPAAEEAGLTRHVGVAQFIEAYVMTAMVDFYGDIPYSEAFEGEANLNPKLDSGASIYDAALVLLDKAIANFQNTATANLANDAFYNNDYTKWVKAANTLKMRLYNQRRLVDPTALSSIQAILNSGNYISSTADDFEYRWPGTNASQPDTRHPRYGLNYTPTGAGDYMSNWLMHYMDTHNDPRIRYYFYRQTDCTPGASCNPAGNEETLQCSVQSAPPHYVSGGFTFCYLDNGYWGRDHQDNDGVPPDGFLRTTYGVYPAGGEFDDDRFSGIVPGTGGGGGAGITPILTAAWVDFMQAEIAMVNNDPGTAKTFLSSGLTKHIAKVQTFGSLDTSADLSYEPTASDVSDFISSVETDFDNAASMSDKWDILAEEYFVTVFGNGIESYNFYRRTGYPTTLQPSQDPSPGVFARSMFYPSNAVNTNSNITQKPGVTEPVFWDNNPSAPIAN